MNITTIAAVVSATEALERSGRTDITGYLLFGSIFAYILLCFVLSIIGDRRQAKRDAEWERLQAQAERGRHNRAVTITECERYAEAVAEDENRGAPGEPAQDK